MILTNNNITIEVSSLGAELTSLKKDNIEYLWQANPDFWKRYSPILFPIVGRLLDDEYIYDNSIYKLSQHGFARDLEFDLIDQKENYVSYKLVSSKKTLKKYPFEFELIISYTLTDNKVIVGYEVINKDSKELPFQIGGHPAFNFDVGSSITIGCETNRYMLNKTPYIQSIEKNVYIDSIIINDETFVDDALIYNSVNKIEMKDKEKAIEINCKHFPYIGIWSKVLNSKMAPFICIEPWFGIADFNNHNKQFTEKKGMNFLKPNEVFKASYSITAK